jgi:hypothetical protein
MKKIYLVLSVNILACALNAQTFQWAKAEGKYAYDYGYGINTDNSGNLYVAGKYEENAVFSNTTVSCAGNHDGFIVKYDPSGNLQWVRTFGGSLGDYCEALSTDKSNFVYVSGEIEGGGTISFPGSAVTLQAKGDNDIVLAKYDLSGNLQWAISEGWKHSEKGLGNSVDPSGNVYVCGYFTDTTIINNSQIVGKGGRDIYVAKYNSNGVFQWVRTAGSTGRDEAKFAKCDAAGNVYICGMVSNNAMFGSTSITTGTNSTFDAFVAKYDTNGNLVWVKSAGGEWDDVAWSMTIDNAGKLFVTGEFNAYANFGGTFLTTTGSADVFVACYDESGNVMWAKGAGGSMIDRARGIGTDGTIMYITGQFGSTASFGANSIMADDSSDIFISAISNSGNFMFATKVGGTPDAFEGLGYESGNAVCGFHSGNEWAVYATGGLLNGGAFGALTPTVTGYSRTDAFVTKLTYDPGTAGLTESKLINGSFFPNPSNGLFYLKSSVTGDSPLNVKVLNQLGQVIFSDTFSTSNNIAIDLSSEAEGIYFVEVSDGKNMTGREKVIVQH